MRTIKIIAFLIAFCTYNAQAQSKTTSSNQSRTIEINNDNGDLYISFKNGVVTEFVVNDNPVSEDRYIEYQKIIDDFTEEEPTPPIPPTPPTPADDEDHTEMIQLALMDYLTDNGLISSTNKYKIHLKKEFLKVNGKKMTKENLHACLELFEEVYGHELNRRSEVKFKKSRKNSSSSIRIAK